MMAKSAGVLQFRNRDSKDTTDTHTRFIPYLSSGFLPEAISATLVFETTRRYADE